VERMEGGMMGQGGWGGGQSDRRRRGTCCASCRAQGGGGIPRRRAVCPPVHATRKAPRNKQKRQTKKFQNFAEATPPLHPPPYLALSYHIISYHIISYHIISGWRYAGGRGGTAAPLVGRPRGRRGSRDSAWRPQCGSRPGRRFAKDEPLTLPHSSGKKKLKPQKKLGRKYKSETVATMRTFS